MLALACPRDNGRFIFCAPTKAQAREIFWDDIKKLVPEEAVRDIWEGTTNISLKNGNKIQIDGLDKPQRIEGSPIDFIVIDEMADTREEAFSRHIRPALDTDGRPGVAWFIGVPRGRGLFYKLFLRAQDPNFPDWKAHTWPSSDILSKEVIEAAKRDLDPLTYEQEYCANFINFQGRIYYTFDRQIHAARALAYRPEFPINVAFDFNVDPGVCVISQDRPVDESSSEYVTHCIDEIFIENDSNTERVGNELVSKWGHHSGTLEIDGDATGGARRSSALEGSDWDILIGNNPKGILRRGFPKARIVNHVKRSNPLEKSRVIAVNNRMLSGAEYEIFGDQMRIDRDSCKPNILVDPYTCPNLVNDFEGVSSIPGTTGVIDKKKDPDLTHLSDAFGYHIARKYPARLNQNSWQ